MSTLRKALAAVVLVATGSMGGAALATHSFPDVPTNSTFHAEIDEIAVAGCVDGFNDGTYRPRKNATRGQLARFISRCGGRAAHAQSEAPVEATVSNENVEVLSTEITATASGFVMVAGMVNAEATVASTARVAAAVADDEESSLFAADNLSTAGSRANLAVNHLFPITAGETKTVTIEAEFDGTGPVRFEGELSLVFVPFSGMPVT